MLSFCLRLVWRVVRVFSWTTEPGKAPANLDKRTKKYQEKDRYPPPGFFGGPGRKTNLYCFIEMDDLEAKVISGLDVW